ncbi:hypothetical protein JYB62_18325 [Algoriphagus lutimaris]|uniref:hypothetical protein n=1 Tax=Algoriphagus lutimaris TaxID=613197 RepID=UPI00196A8F23|nr:hypothetical protein [Algoriphagus lutimaris]MBN3521966.1 hypothetical protein [Algoriphagus lutimaris]
MEIEILVPVGIRDYDPVKDVCLGYVDKGSDGVGLAIFDAQGKIIISKVRRGEGSNDYSSSALTMGLGADGNI